jgi:hypothetical protein
MRMRKLKPALDVVFSHNNGVVGWPLFNVKAWLKRRDGHE